MAINISVRDIRINKSSQHIRSYHCLKKGLILFSAFILVCQNKEISCFPGETWQTHWFSKHKCDGGWCKIRHTQGIHTTLSCRLKLRQWSEEQSTLQCFEGLKNLIHLCLPLGNFFLIFACKTWFKDLNDFFFPLKIACQNNTCFRWPHGRHGNCANPSHWYYSPPSIYHVCAFKRLKKPLGFVIGYFFLYPSLKNSGTIIQSVSILGEAVQGEEHHFCSPDFCTGLTNPEPLGKGVIRSWVLPYALIHLVANRAKETTEISIAGSPTTIHPSQTQTWKILQEWGFGKVTTLYLNDDLFGQGFQEESCTAAVPKELSTSQSAHFILPFHSLKKHGSIL